MKNSTCPRSAYLILASLALTLCASSQISADLTDGNPNAATLYRKSASLLTALPEEIRIKMASVVKDGWKVQDGNLEEVLKSNQAAINEFEQASRLTYCQFTSAEHLERDFSAELPKYVDEITVARLVLLEGRRLEKDNQWDAALEKYLAVLRFANHLGQQKKFMLLSKLVEIIVRRLAYGPLEGYVRQSRMDVKTYHHLLTNLLSLREQDTGFQSAFEEEKAALRNTIRKEVKRKGWTGAFYDYEKMYREFDRLDDESFGYLMTALKDCQPELYEEKIKQLRKQVDRPKSFAFVWKYLLGRLGLPGGIDHPTLVARVLWATGAPAYAKVITRYYASLSERDALITAVAVRLYELESGRVPDSLQELVPTYLLKVPEDPFDGFKPFKYEKSGKQWVVYSIGPDRQDDHGSRQYEGQNSDGTGDIFVSASYK